jgi:hypothetical protein
VVAATLAAVTLSALIHYEGLVTVSQGLNRIHLRNPRIKVLYAILCVLVLHVAEIWVFGLAIWLLMLWPECGHLATHGSLYFLDAIYLSAVTFTTVGYGDIAPVGPIRFLSGTEALCGLVFITWSASFTYLEMERFWRRN